MAEQIRQQQLAAALESRLDSQSFSAMQAALLMNKLKAGAETSKLLAAASSNSTVSVLRNERPKGRGKKQAQAQAQAQAEAGVSSDKLNKDTVASLLAKIKCDLGATHSTPHAHHPPTAHITMDAPRDTRMRTRRSTTPSTWSPTSSFSP